MSLIGASHERVDSGEPIDDRGRWRIPEIPGIELTGTVTFSREEGGLLTLDGGFLDPESYFNQKIENITILGDTKISNDRITIIDAVYDGSRTRGGSAQTDIVEETWIFSTMLVGGHLETPDTARFQLTSLSTRMLPEWAPARTSIEPPTASDEVGVRRIEVEVPPSMATTIEGAEAKLAWFEGSTHSRTRASMTITPTFAFSFTQGLTLDTIWEKYALPTLFLTTFATGSPDRIEQFHVLQKTDNSGPDSPAEHETYNRYRVMSTRLSGVVSETNSRWWEFQLPFDVFKDNYSSVVSSWFALHNNASDAFLEFFSTTLYPGTLLEEDFTRTVRSLEIWHRKMFGGRIMSENDYTVLLEKLQQSCTTVEWDLVRMRMQYGNEITQKKRLDNLIERAGDRPKELVARYRKASDQKFTRAVIAMRNQMTHGLGENEPPALSDVEMSWATHTLKLIFSCNIIRLLGISAADAESVTIRSSLWRRITNKFNPWLT